ncbi:MAG: YjbQ family protein, partial [Dehalococcoidia bacterium]|nr:YjbQ family protein [Dehalococcoidia bacterium]
MTVITEDITLESKGDCHIIDITSQVAGHVQRSGVDSGIVTLFVVGSTAGITTIEYEPNLLADFSSMWDRLMPRNIPYEHDRTWGDGNGHSHVRASALGPSLVVPFMNRKLTLGTWQQIILVDFDNRPRTRRVAVQILGE